MTSACVILNDALFTHISYRVKQWLNGCVQYFQFSSKTSFLQTLNTTAYCICMFVLMLIGNFKTSMGVSFPCVVCFYAQESLEVLFVYCVSLKSVTKVTNEYQT